MRHPARTLWGWARVETILPYVLAAGVLVAGVIVLGEEAARHVDRFEAWIAGLGPWAVTVFVLLYAVLSSVFVPDVLLGIVAGASFGFTWGLLAAAAGCVGGAAVQYALSRRLLKPIIDRFLAPRPALVAVQAAVRQQELRLQVLLRLTPLNRALTSYVLGAAGVGFVRFAIACSALLPSLALEVYFGYAGRHLAAVAGQPVRTVVLHDAALVAGLAVGVAVMVMVARAARRAVEAAAAHAGAPGAPERRARGGDQTSRLER